MGKVVVLSGMSGAGKSSYANRLLGSWRFNSNEAFKPRSCLAHHSDGVSVSADSYFMVEGKYNFDVSKLGEAHGRCFRDFIEALNDAHPLVVVDNTNLTSEEIAPYMLGAQAFGYEAELITLQPRPLFTETFPSFIQEYEYVVQALAERNVHGVSLNAIRQQLDRLRARILPPWWKHTVVDVEVVKKA